MHQQFRLICHVLSSDAIFFTCYRQPSTNVFTENGKLSKLLCKHHHHLPEDLWPEILSKLPSKSLVRFRCISKPWLSLISDPDFHRLHLKNFKNNADETHLLVVEGQQQNCVLKCSETFETKSATLLSLGENSKNARWCYKLSIDGLILLASSRRGSKGLRNLMLWNPSIRKFHVFPFVPEIKTAPSFFMDAEIGFGIDPIIKDYKHVKLMFKDEKTLHSVAVYTLGVGLWKIVPFQGKGASNWHWFINFDDMKSVCLHGCFYFIARNRVTKVWELVSFDLRSEVFCPTSLPDAGNIRSFFYYSGSLALVEGGCLLAVFVFGVGNSMWVMEESSKHESKWIKRYSFDVSISSFRYVKKKGDMSLKWYTEMTN